jgi:hypothetical protein
MMIFRNLSQKRASQNSTTDAAIMKGEITTKRRERDTHMNESTLLVLILTQERYEKSSTQQKLQIPPPYKSLAPYF